MENVAEGCIFARPSAFGVDFAYQKRVGFRVELAGLLHTLGVAPPVNATHFSYSGRPD